MDGLNHLLEALGFLIYIVAGGLVAGVVLAVFGFSPLCVHRNIEIKLDPSCNKPEVLKKWGIVWNTPEEDDYDEYDS